MVKSFTTAVIESEKIDAEDEVTYPFEIDGVECLAYQPKAGQLAFLLAAVAEESAWTKQAAGIINSFLAMVDDDTRVLIGRRLLDRKDTFDVEEVRQIIEWLIEEWSGKDDSKPSASPRSRSATGTKSSPRSRK